MTVAQLTFDTLAYANRLKSAGFEPKLAEAQADAQAELMREFADNQFASKQDIKDLEGKLERKIDKIDAKVELLESQLTLLESKLTIKLGGIMVAGIGLMATLLTIFHVH